jgi:hypothetical protein
MYTSGRGLVVAVCSSGVLAACVDSEYTFSLPLVLLPNYSAATPESRHRCSGVVGTGAAACHPRCEVLAYASRLVSHARSKLTAKHDSLLLCVLTDPHATNINSGELHTKPRHCSDLKPAALNIFAPRRSSWPNSDRLGEVSRERKTSSSSSSMEKYSQFRDKGTSPKLNCIQ